MTLDITLPALPGGAARVLRWIIAEGEEVAAGAPLVILLTERAELLLPAPGAGVLAALVPAGEQVEPGGRLGRLEPAEESVASRPRVFATPLARAIARDRGVDLEVVVGSGPGGRVLARDVGDHRAEAPQPSALSPQPLALSPHLPTPIATATVEFDASAALAVVAAHREAFARLRLPLGLTARVAEAAAALLPAHQPLNAAWGDEAIVLRRRVHLAVAEPDGDGGGLGWALVRDAGDLMLRGVARALARRDEPAGATFAVVSLAAGASWQSAAPPLPATAAALSVGAPVARPAVVGEALAVRPLATLTLAYDARVLDHGAAAAFLTALRASLERAQ